MITNLRKISVEVNYADRFKYYESLTNDMKKTIKLLIGDTMKALLL